MPKKRTTCAPELLVPLTRGAGRPLRAQVEDRLRGLMRAGVLRPGSLLPATRVLARDLRLSRGVVVEAYAQLAAEGYLDTQRGAGTRIAAAAQATRAPSAPPSSAPHLRYDFRPGVPDLALFPRPAWSAAVRRVLRDAPATAFGYGDPRGAAELRGALAAYLGRVRGVVADPELLLLCTGFAQGLSLLCAVLRARGDVRIAVEDPTHPGQRAIIVQAGLQPVPVPVDEDGVRLDVLTRSDAHAVLVTPAHQFPTGVVLAPARRGALVAWARERDAVIVEDDYDAEYRYDRAPVGALQGLAPEHVVYAGSASKTLAPALRLGWLVAPAHLMDALSAAKQHADLGSPTLEQLAFASVLESGGVDRHLRRVRDIYRARRDALVRALAQHAPAAQVRGVAAGLHAVAQLPAGMDERAVVIAAAQCGVRVSGMAEYRALDGSQCHPPALVLGYAALSEAAIAAGVSTLAQIL